MKPTTETFEQWNEEHALKHDLDKFYHLLRLVMPARSGWDLGSKNNLDEWHLHEYHLALIEQHTADVFAIADVKRIPFFFIPFRYVLTLTK